MKHKRRYVLAVKGARNGRAITIILTWCCVDFKIDRFIKCMGSGKPAKDEDSGVASPKSFLGVEEDKMFDFR